MDAASWFFKQSRQLLIELVPRQHGGDMMLASGPNSLDLHVGRIGDHTGAGMMLLAGGHQAGNGAGPSREIDDYKANRWFRLRRHVTGELKLKTCRSGGSADPRSKDQIAGKKDDQTPGSGFSGDGRFGRGVHR